MKAIGGGSRQGTTVDFGIPCISKGPKMRVADSRTIAKYFLCFLITLLHKINSNAGDNSDCITPVEILLNAVKSELINFDVIVSIPETNPKISEMRNGAILREITPSRMKTFSLGSFNHWADEEPGPNLVIFPCLNATEFSNTLLSVANMLHLKRQNARHERFWIPIFIFTHPKLFSSEMATKNDTLVKDLTPILHIDSRIYLLYSLNSGDNARMKFVLREIYSVRKHPINQIVHRIPFGFDSSENHFLDKLKFHTLRRSNFQKTPVIAIGIDDLDYPLATAFKPNTSELTGGFEVEIYHYFRDALNFSEIAVKGTGYVREGPNQTLTGYSQELNKDIGDIAIGAGEFLEYRVKGPDGITYIHPMFHANVIAYFKQPPASSIRNIFTQTFTLDLWVCSLFVWILIIFLLKISVRLVRRIKGGFNNSKDDKMSEESIIWAAGAMCQQGWHISPHSTPVKIVFFCGVFTGLISYVAYSAALVSILAVEVVPIREFKDLITEKFYITSDSHIPTAKVVVKDLEDKKQIPKLGEGVRNVEIADNLEKMFKTRFALVTIPDSFYPVIQQNYTNDFICRTVATKVVSPRPLKSSCFVKRGAAIREFLNYKLLVMQERGIKFRLIKEYVYGTSVQCLGSSGSAQLQLGLRDLFTAFAILAAGFTFSLSMALIEKLYSVKIIDKRLMNFKF